MTYGQFPPRSSSNLKFVIRDSRLRDPRPRPREQLAEAKTQDIVMLLLMILLTIIKDKPDLFKVNFIQCFGGLVVYKGAFFATSFLLQLAEAKTRDFLMLPALAGRFFLLRSTSNQSIKSLVCVYYWVLVAQSR